MGCFTPSLLTAAIALLFSLKHLIYDCCWEARPFLWYNKRPSILIHQLPSTNTDLHAFFLRVWWPQWSRCDFLNGVAIKCNYEKMFCYWTARWNQSNFPAPLKNKETLRCGRQWSRGWEEEVWGIDGPPWAKRRAAASQPDVKTQRARVLFRHILDKYLYTINCIDKSPGEGKLFCGMSITDFTGR